MNDAPPTGVILLSHPEQNGISRKEMRDALPDIYKEVLPEVVELDTAESASQAVRFRDWAAAARVLADQFHAKVEPLRERYPDYPIVYFGSSPVPLAIFLGFLLRTFRQVEIIPHHHGTRAWGWAPPLERPPRLAKNPLPEEKDRSPGDAIIRVSTSHQVDARLTREVIPEPIVEIDVALEHPDEDAFSCLEEMQEVANAFRRALDLIGSHFSGIERVHVFAAVQPGIALLLGNQISSTMHPPVQTYQYVRNAENGVFHVPAVLVNGPSRPDPQPLTAEQEEQAPRDRRQLEKDLARMKGFAAQEQGMQTTSWLASVLSSPTPPPSFSSEWLNLPMLHATPLRETKMDVSTRAVEDSFRLSPSSEWQIDDHWLGRLARRLPADEGRRRALRGLVLHEAMHRGPQALTRTSSQGIGRFPKVVEEIDYHADVWAMLYEHALTRLQSPAEVEPPRSFFMQLIRGATETMWAFDDDGLPLQEIQIRRLNRYLIWYWQYLCLERGSGGGKEMTLDAVVSLLSRRPIIELAGPAVHTHDERVFFALDPRHMKVPELAVYHDGRLFRHGTRFDFSIAALLDGVRTRDGEKILGVLRAAVEQTVR